VRSPFHSEQEAFRFVLLLTLAALPIVLAAALGPTWLALVVLAVVLAALVVRMAQLHMRKRGSLVLPLKSAPAHLGPVTERRVLVVANDTLSDEALLSEVQRLASTPHTRVLLLVPALVSSGARLTGAVDRALDQARVRLGTAIDRVSHDLNIAGEISEADPLEAIEDAFATFAADEVIVSTRSERGRGGLEPGLADLVRERFAVPVRHLVVEPGSGAHEPDKDAEARYRHEFDEVVAARKRKVGLEALAGAGILAALLISAVALGRSSESTTPQVVVTQAARAAPAAQVIDLQVIPSYKLGPDGKKHDAYTTTDFSVKVGQPVKLRIDNTDTQPHSFFSPGAGVNMVILPGTHTYTLVVYHAGRFRWLCVTPCDSGANGWAMRHPGYMSGYITAT
jgi:hypothetical protein